MPRAAGFAAADTPPTFFDRQHYTNGVWALNDPANPNAKPGTFVCAPGAVEIGTPVDIKYDIDSPHGTYLHARVHEIQIGNLHKLLAAHPYDPGKPHFPTSFVEYKHKGNSHKHDVVEAPDGRRFHVHRRK